MSVQDVTVAMPEHLFQRLQNAAAATQRPRSDILIRAVEVGSPPGWEDVPAEFQVELASLDRLNDEALWQFARQRRSEAHMQRWQDLLNKNANGTLTQEEAAELAQMRTEADRLTLRKAHAAALRRWRGHALQPAESSRDQ